MPTQEQKDLIHSELDLIVVRLNEKLRLNAESIARELFYRLQRHPQFGYNATKTHKNDAFIFWDKTCQKCKNKLDRKEAVFHHRERGIANQHSPNNLVPQHVKCHNNEHCAIKGSVKKGSQNRKVKKAVGSL